MRIIRAYIHTHINTYIPIYIHAEIYTYLMIGGNWAAALEAYMLGRQMQAQLPRGNTCRVVSVHVVGALSSQSYSSRSGVWKGLLNRSCYAGIAANKVPQLHVNDRPGANTYMTALSLMRLMRLHPVEPKDEEVMQLGVDASFSSYLMNGINQGRLRSQDYLTWVKA